MNHSQKSESIEMTSLTKENRIYQDFFSYQNGLLLNLEKKQVFFNNLFNREDLKDRFAQLIYLHTYSCFISSKFNKSESSRRKLVLNFSQIQFTTYGYMYFLVAWLNNWIKISSALFKNAIGCKKKLLNVNLIYSMNLEDTIQNEYEKVDEPNNFFSSGPINFLNKGDQINIFQAYQFKIQKDHIYCPDPLLYLTENFKLKLSDRVKLLSNHCLMAVTFLKDVIKFKENLLLYKEYAFLPLLNTLCETKIINNIAILNSYASDQNLALFKNKNRKYQTHIIFYSMNSFAFNYKGLLDRDILENPYWANILVDQAWIWNKEQADWFRKFNSKTKINVVGPLIFRKLPQVSSAIPKKIEKVVIFDVTPVSKEFREEKELILGFHYYQTDICLSFLKDLVEILNEFSIQVSLKPKRSYTSQFDPIYTDQVKQFATDRKLDLLHPSANLIDVIASTDLVLTNPYSSTAFLAIAMGKPVIFYDPSSLLNYPNFYDSKLFFFSGREELRNNLQKMLGQ